MKKAKLILIVFLIPLILFSCKKDPENEPEAVIADIELSQKDKALIESSNEFGLRLFQQVNSTEENTSNVFISPMSVAYALAMTYNGANKETKTAMEEAMKLSGLTTSEINSSFKYLMNALVNLDPEVIVQIANSIWYRDTFEVLDSLISVS